MTALPIALTCGDPSGIGPELSVGAWKSLGASLPFFWLGDPRHLPEAAPVVRIADPSEAADAAAKGLPVLPHDFAVPAQPGQPDPANAQGVIDVIARAVDLVHARCGCGALHQRRSTRRR